MLLVTLTGVMLLVCITAYEAVRWAECSFDCEEEHVRHRLLLESSICLMDASSSGRCEEARRALRFTPQACVIRSFWRNGEIYRFYNMLAQSPVTLVATFLLLAWASFKWYAMSPSQPTPLQRQIYAQYGQREQ